MPSERRAVTVPGGPPPIGPYSPAVWSDDTLFLSGVTGAGDDVAAQTRSALDGLAERLRAAGITLDHVVKCNVYLVDMGQFATMNAVYETFFDEPRPARTTVAVAALPRGAQVEIECIARRPAQHGARGFRAMVADAERVIPTLSIEQAQALLGRENVTFVDVRDIRELEREGRIPGSFHAPRGMLEFWIDPNSPYHKPIFGQRDRTFVFYCAGGWRSALAAQTAHEMGLPFVAHVAGGFTDWAAADAPAEPYAKREKPA